MKFDEFIALLKIQNLGNDTRNSWYKDWLDVIATNVMDWEEFSKQTFKYLYSYL